MFYRKLLHVLKDKSFFYRFKDYLKPHVVQEELTYLIKYMDKYFINNPSVSSIDYEDFILKFKMDNVSLSKEKHSFYDMIFSGLSEDEPTEEETKAILESFIEKDYAIKMSDYLTKISEGDDSKAILDVESFIRDYKTETGKVSVSSAYIVEDELDDILDNHMRTGLNWRLNELNESIGPIRQGDFMVVTSRPDSGKTTFLCSEATFMAKQLDPELDVIWFNNEETRRKVKQRIYQAALGWTKEDLAANKLKTRAELEKALGRIDRVKVVDDKNLSVAVVEDVLENSKAGLIIFDQLWKIVGFKEAFSETDRMRLLFGWARELADKYAPVINVHQADGSAHGEMYINMNQLYNSKTGIQGEADVILGIGRSLDTSPAEVNKRYLYVSKNKLDGGPMTRDDMRNGRYQVEIQPTVARFKGML